MLLIEPVWNRNVRAGLIVEVPNIRAFNRTSMESKHWSRVALFSIAFTFNRTSMESKLGCYLLVHVDCVSLLIEPVWNRNSSLVVASTSGSLLLIEPVWNRNTGTNNPREMEITTFNRTSMESKRSPSTPPADRSSPPFNRTSMESKHAVTRDYNKIIGAFNRTSMESKRASDIYDCSNSCVAFNRTSMESKQKLETDRALPFNLLIEPVWNRNKNLKPIGRCPLIF